MIIRKPYAFLIKNFRLIHLLMLVLSGYLLYKTYNALQFFNVYVSTRQFIESDTLINDTLPILMVLFSILLVLMSVAIIVLFRKKDKPVLFYIGSTIFFIVLIILTIVSRGMISTIIIEGIDPRVSRILRDFFRISFFIEIAITGFYLIRTLGFDVKKFHFGEDINELKIEDEDSEEYELTTKFDADKVKMYSKMRKEDLKAFYYENKLMILVISFLLFIMIPTAIIAKTIINNKRYIENEVINLKRFEFKVLETNVTKKKYNGDTLFTGENSYLIVKFNIKNYTEKERGINLNNLRLEIGNKVYANTTTHYDYFTDLGVGYTSQKITNESKDYIAVFVIKDEDLSKQILLRYADRVTVKNNEATAKYYRTILNPKQIDKDTVTTNTKIGEELLFDDAKFTINKYEIKEYYTYKVNNRTKYLVNNTGLIMRLDYTYTSNNRLETFKDFLNAYVNVKYVIKGRAYKKSIDNITISNDDNKVYLWVNEDIKNAEEIYLVINLRNAECNYKLK